MGDYDSYKKKYDELKRRLDANNDTVEYWDELVEDIRQFAFDPNVPQNLRDIASFSMWESAGMMRDSVALIIEHEKRKNIDDNGGNNGKR